MISNAIEIMQNINNYHTTLGRIGLTIDGVGVALSLSFYGLGLGDFVNGFLPPIILVLTALSISTSLVFKCASEYRLWKKRREDRK